ncbi:hypothetical protein V8C43DRAFT_329027 [Trichoderma afarasin]
MDTPRLTYDEYTVGWIAVLPCEIDAARLLLDHEHPDLPALRGDTNNYILGDMGGHNVAIAFPGAGRKGIASATDTATNIIRTFSKIRFGLLVGVAGGVPKLPSNKNTMKDIRLGDIVVGCPDRGTGGVIQLDSGKWLQPDKIDVQSHLNKPPIILLTAAEKLRGDLKFRKAKIETFIQSATDKAFELEMEEYAFPGRQNDRLFQSEHLHVTPEEDESCSQCLTDWEVQRSIRTSEKPAIHYGLIGSSNQVVRSADYRDQMQNLGILCFEMEAAGLMDTFPCLVIRGISDYSDSHKNKLWQPYAALTAGAYARDLLRVIQVIHVMETKIVMEVVQKLDAITDAVEGVGTNIVNAYNQGKYQIPFAREHRFYLCQASEEKREILRRQERDNDKFDKALNKLRDELLSTNEASVNLSQGSRQEPHPRTCTWLFNDSRFKKWIDEKFDTPILWLYGAPRAGKTVLCTAAIDHVKEMRGTESTIYAYVSDSAEFSPSQLLSNFALQLLDNLRKCKSCLHEPIDLQQFIGVSRKDDKEREKLVSHLIKALPATYIFIDGLDGADHYTVRQNSMSLASYERGRPEQNMKRVLNFLCTLTEQYSPKVRLWCSSQFDSTRRRAWMSNYEKLTLDFQLQLDDTKNDIANYLLECIEGTFPSLGRVKILRPLLLQVIKIQGSFSWARLLHDEIEQQPDTKSLMRLLEDEKLPGSINKYYEKHINRIKYRERGRVEPALWKIVLSLVMYAKRPLLKSEVIEAIAILRTESGDLDPDYKPRDDSVLNACHPLVKIITQRGEKENDPIITLHDGGVREFLEGSLELRSDHHTDDELVDAGIFRDTCIRYLTQPKYEKFLKKIDTGTFKTWETNEDIISHNLLGYCVKYWHQHFDTPSAESPPEAEIKKVKQLVESTHFATCVQVQSLVVEGHFAHRIDDITDQAASTKRVFPNWLLKSELFRQYSIFSSEWSELLQSGLTSNLNGELDRCIWMSLGHNHFLSSLPCRYESFIFATKDTEASNSSRCWIQKLSPNHEYITSCYFNTLNQSIEITHWSLGGSGNSSLQTLMFNRQDVSLDSYQLPCSAFIPLIPSLSCLEPPYSLSIFPNASVMRVGSKLFAGVCPEESSTVSKSISTLDDRIGNFWDDVNSRNDIMVVCRRRVPKASTWYKEPSLSRGLHVDTDTTDSDEYDSQASLPPFHEMQMGEDMMTMDIESAEESWSDSDGESNANSTAGSFSALLDAPNMDSEQNDANGENSMLDCNFSDSGSYSAGYASDHSGGGSYNETEASATDSASESDSLQSIVTCSQLSQDEDEAKIQALAPSLLAKYAMEIFLAADIFAKFADCLFVASVWAHAERGV